MKVAYLSINDAKEVKHWSGLVHYMYKCVADQGVQVSLVNCGVPYSKWLKLKAKLIKLITGGKTYQLDRDPTYAKQVAANAEEQLKALQYDVVFAPGSLPFIYLQTNKPMVFWTDATFDAMVGFYPGWHNLSQLCLKYGDRAEQIAIDKSSLVLYASEWARSSAINHYGADPRKIKQVPFGANMEALLSQEEVKAAIRQRQQSDLVNLLFVGIDWERKGGDLAIETVVKLREKGVNAELTLVGSQLPERFNMPFIKHYPLLKKSVKEDAEKLHALYKSATFFILPTRAECFGVVFAEAGAYGLPVITSNVGGCPSAVKDGYSGFCLDLNDFSTAAVEKINGLRTSPQLYEQFSLNAYERFNNELNWGVIGKKVVQALQTVVEEEG
ncbi:MAG: glycosyltransferase family 4 protein [Williamsia sp.]|nr:glycosyltransferase family 4 protein [Williamsia sp.]